MLGLCALTQLNNLTSLHIVSNSLIFILVIASILFFTFQTKTKKVIYF